jgi:hypothetical protein
MIHLRELCSLEDYETAEHDVQFNLQRLHYCLNFIRVLYDKPMIVNSGLRSKEKHFQIYKKINDDRSSRGLPSLNIPMRSLHLRGAAADIRDVDGDFKRWILDNLEVAEDLGVYFESFEATPTWAHIQCYPPKSGKRFFNP